MLSNLKLDYSAAGSKVNGLKVSAGDGVAISQESALELTATDSVEALLFDLK